MKNRTKDVYVLLNVLWLCAAVCTLLSMSGGWFNFISSFALITLSIVMACCGFYRKMKSKE